MSYPFLGGFGLQYVCSICLASSSDGSGDVNGQCRIISASHVVLTLPRPNGRRRRYLPSNTVSGRSCSLSSSNLSSDSSLSALAQSPVPSEKEPRHPVQSESRHVHPSLNAPLPTWRRSVHSSQGHKCNRVFARD